MLIPPEEPPTLAYLEHHFATAYQAQPAQAASAFGFLAASTLQLALLALLAIRLPPGLLAHSLFALAILLLLLALICEAISLYPRTEHRIARAPALLLYAQTLMQRERDQAKAALDDPFSALVTLKSELARQFASAIDHNCLVHLQRERWRNMALLAGLAALLMMLPLVAMLLRHG